MRTGVSMLSLLVLLAAMAAAGAATDQRSGQMEAALSRPDGTAGFTQAIRTPEMLMLADRLNARRSGLSGEPDMEEVSRFVRDAITRKDVEAIRSIPVSEEVFNRPSPWSSPAHSRGRCSARSRKGTGTPAKPS